MKFLKTLFFLLKFIGVNSHEVILSAGIIGDPIEKIQVQFNKYKSYKNSGLITASSVLAYNINENGNLGTYNTRSLNMSAEDFQMSLQKLNLKSYPCIFCDATIGRCKNFGDRIEKVYLNEEKFIEDTLSRAVLYNWDGYTIDFEPDQMIDGVKLSNFVVNWANSLDKYNLTLYVWIGGPTQYNLGVFYPIYNIKLVTMNTYSLPYSSFIETASGELVKSGRNSKMGFGFLTDYNSNVKSIPERDIGNILGWLNIANAGFINLWASNIPAHWYEALFTYVNN